MAAYAILVGTKGNQQTAIAINTPEGVKVKYKEEIEKGAKCKFDALEIVNTRSGRSHKWRNTKREPQAAP